MQQDRSVGIGDRWNFFYLLALATLAADFVVRCTDSASACGRSLHAVSAPLVFTHILFFAQILRFQGPMIQAGTVWDVLCFPFDGLETCVFAKFCIGERAMQYSGCVPCA